MQRMQQRPCPISDTASVVELTSDANMETEMQSVSDSDTTETSAQETDQVALPAIWQETYTYLADTQDAHTFPEQIEKSGTSYQLKDVQYQITELTKEYSKSSVDLWAYAEYTPEQEIDVDGLHYTLVDTSKEEWTKVGEARPYRLSVPIWMGRKSRKLLILNQRMM